MADTVNWIQAVHQQEREAQITKSSAATWPTSGLGFTPAAAAGITKSLRSTTPCTLATIDEEFEDSPLTKAEASLFTKILVYGRNSLIFIVKHPNLLKGIYSMKFSKPSKIQEKALPLLLADPPQNLIAQSQSGTGKTAAFVLAMLTRVDASKPYPQILCLSPTFDLAQQTGKVLQQMAQYFPEIKMKYAVRGSRVFQHRLSNEKVTEHILIGTAGTTLDWAVKYRVFDPKLINMFVLDEGDVMIDTQGQQDQTIRLHRLLRTDCQNVLFSATYSEEVMSFANKIISDPNIIRLRGSEESLDNIKQYYVWCTAGDEGKYTALTNIYGVLTIGQCIVFCRTKKISYLACRNLTLAERQSLQVEKDANGACLVAVARLQHFGDSTSSACASSMLPSNDREFIARVGVDGRFSYIDPRVSNILGYLPQDLIGHNSYDYFHPDDMQKMIQLHHEAMKQRTPMPTVHYRFLSKDKKWVWLAMKAFSFVNPFSHQVEYVVCTNVVHTRTRSTGGEKSEQAQETVTQVDASKQSTSGPVNRGASSSRGGMKNNVLTDLLPDLNWQQTSKSSSTIPPPLPAPSTSSQALVDSQSSSVVTQPADTTVQENAVTAQRLVDNYLKMITPTPHRKDFNYGFPPGLFPAEVDLEGSAQAYHSLIDGLENCSDLQQLLNQVDADPVRSNNIFNELDLDIF
uniref:Uncharacterized protein n=1 Tax=Amphimedon queenslandica TaxID=400682 RepID=A0A1X7TVM0_AMPQE